MTNLPPPPPPSNYGPPSSAGAGAVPVGKVKLRGRVALRLAVILGVIGIGLCVVGVVVLVHSPLTKVAEFPRVRLDGSQHVVQLTRTGTYVAYYEAPGLDTRYAAPDIGLQIEGPDGEVPFEYVDRRLTYTYAGRSGIGVVSFHVRRAGRYGVVGGYRASDDINAHAGGSVALGESLEHSLVLGALLFAFGVPLVIVATILLIVGLVKRNRHARELASGYVGHGGPNYFTGRP